MIGFNALGRLGRFANQMFQYASLKGIARNNGYEIIIPNHQNLVNDGAGNMLRTELFDSFKFDGIKIGTINAQTLSEKMFNFEVKYISIGEIDYKSTEEIGKKILNSFYKNDFQECSLFYNHFNSVISQEVKVEKLIPYSESSETDTNNQNNIDTYFEYEPNEEEVLSKILPKNFIVQIYKAILESRASEQGARMTAMDNATRNAGDMIDNLSLKYNRQRQAIITKELIEIISGAEAL